MPAGSADMTRNPMVSSVPEQMARILRERVLESCPPNRPPRAKQIIMIVKVRLSCFWSHMGKTAPMAVLK